MTRAEQDAALAAEIRPILDRHLPGIVHEALAGDLARFVSGYTARQIEKHAHSPRSQRGPGRQQEARTA